MTTPANHTFNIYQGATWDETITLRNADLTPLDIDGLGARMQMRESTDDADVILELNTTNGRLTVTDGPNGVLTLLVSAADTSSLPVDHETTAYTYDLEIYRTTPAPEYVRRVLQGVVIVSPEVTR